MHGFGDLSTAERVWALAGGGTLTGVASTGALGAFAAAAAPVAAVVVIGGAAIYVAWHLGEAIAEAPWNPFTHPREGSYNSDPNASTRTAQKSLSTLSSSAPSGDR